MNFSSLHNSQPQGVVKYKEHRFQTAVHIVVQAVLSLSHALFFLLFFYYRSHQVEESKEEWNGTGEKNLIQKSLHFLPFAFYSST